MSLARGETANASATSAGVLGAGGEVQVAHRGLDVGVAHPLLDAADVGLGDHPGAERVAQVVEAQRAQTGARQGRLVAAAQRRRVEVVATLAGEDDVVIANPVLPATEMRQPRGDVGREGHRADLAGLGRGPVAVVEAGAHADGAAGEVDVAPAQCEQLAHAQARERGGQIQTWRRAPCRLLARAPTPLRGRTPRCCRCLREAASPRRRPGSPVDPRPCAPAGRCRAAGRATCGASWPTPPFGRARRRWCLG